MENRNDIKIAGSGQIGSGIYNTVKISGSGRAAGDIEAASVHVSGSAHFESIQMEDMRVSGSCRIDGSLTGGIFHASGSAHVKGEIQADELVVSGSFHADSPIHARAIRISGSITAKNGIECEQMHVSGGVNVNGLLNADDLEIKLHGSCAVDEIGGSSIRVLSEESSAGLFARLFSSKSFRKLVCRTIEANDIQVENTICDSIHGKNIIIGKGCIIRKAEYTDTISIDETAQVGEYVKI